MPNFTNFCWGCLLCFIAIRCQSEPQGGAHDKEISYHHSADLSDTLSLVFAGDVMCHTAQLEAAQIGANTYQFHSSFKYIKPVLEQFDLAIANLELSLPGVQPYHGYPMFKAPNALAEALKQAGFDLLFTANNHCADSKLQGLRGTTTCLDSLHLLRTGTFRSASDKAMHNPLLVYRKGMKIAFLNYTFGTNGMATPKGTAINMIDTALIRQDLAMTMEAKPEFTIVSMHWGTENQTKQTQEQEYLAKWLVEHGANLIIGTHPHVVQPIQRLQATDTTKSQRQVYAVYSLGNFISAQRTPETSGGVMFAVSLVKKQGKVHTADAAFIPIWRWIAVGADSKPSFYVLPPGKSADALLSPEDLKAKHGHEMRMRQRLHPLRAQHDLH